MSAIDPHSRRAEIYFTQRLISRIDASEELELNCGASTSEASFRLAHDLIDWTRFLVLNFIHLRGCVTEGRHNFVAIILLPPTYDAVYRCFPQNVVHTLCCKWHLHLVWCWRYYAFQNRASSCLIHGRYNSRDLGPRCSGYQLLLRRECGWAFQQVENLSIFDKNRCKLCTPVDK